MPSEAARRAADNWFRRAVQHGPPHPPSGPLDLALVIDAEFRVVADEVSMEAATMVKRYRDTWGPKCSCDGMANIIARCIREAFEVKDGC